MADPRKVDECLREESHELEQTVLKVDECAVEIGVYCSHCGLYFGSGT